MLGNILLQAGWDTPSNNNTGTTYTNVHTQRRGNSHPHCQKWTICCNSHPAQRFSQGFSPFSCSNLNSSISKYSKMWHHTNSLSISPLKQPQTRMHSVIIHFPLSPSARLLRVRVAMVTKYSLNDEFTGNNVSWGKKLILCLLACVCFGLLIMSTGASWEWCAQSLPSLCFSD